MFEPFLMVLLCTQRTMLHSVMQLPVQLQSGTLGTGLVCMLTARNSGVSVKLVQHQSYQPMLQTSRLPEAA